MTLTKEQFEELKVAAQPLVQWLRANCHPNTSVEVTCTDAELKEGIALQKFDL